MNKRCSTLLLAVLLYCGCHSRQKNPYENNLHLQPGYLAQLDLQNYTEITWLDTLQHFGPLREGDSARLVFRFRNTGNKPLFLSQARTSCGCTLPSFPQQPFFPGEEGELIARFNSMDHPGFNRKSIEVVSNTNNGTKHYLILTGEVIPAPNTQTSK